MMALGAVKSGVAFYKEAKSVGKEAVGVITEIADGLGAFFEHQEKAVAQAKEIEKNPPKGKSLQAIALDNVLRRKKLEQAEADLRTMLTWEAPPELGALWSEFQAERSKLLADKDKFDRAQKKRINKKLSSTLKIENCFSLRSQYVLQFLSFHSLALV
jgi:hypothetical protein